MKHLELYFSKKHFKNDKNRNDYEYILTRFLNDVELLSLSPFLLNEYIQSDAFTTYIPINQGQTAPKRYSPKTLEKHIDILRSFLNIMFSEGIITEDLADSLKHTEQKRGISLSQLPHAKELLTLSDYFNGMASIDDYYSLKDLIIFNLILHSGCSSEEIVSVDIDGLGISENRYFIFASLPKERYININSDTAKLISRLIELRGHLATSTNALFINQKQKTRLSSRSIRNIIKSACEACGLNNYSAEKVKNAGIIAALSAHYPAVKLAHELGINSAYFNRRISRIITSEAEVAYADLFSRGV